MRRRSCEQNGPGSTPNPSDESNWGRYLCVLQICKSVDHLQMLVSEKLVYGVVRSVNGGGLLVTERQASLVSMTPCNLEDGNERELSKAWTPTA